MKYQRNDTWLQLTKEEEQWKKNNSNKVLNTLKGEKLKAYSQWRKEQGLFHRRKPTWGQNLKPLDRYAIL